MTDLKQKYGNKSDRFTLEINRKEVASFIVGEREGRIRLRGLDSHEKRQGYASQILKNLTELADKYHLVIELTASPHGDEETRMNHEQLQSFYSKFGFEMEEGFDPSYGYMIRKPKY